MLSILISAHILGISLAAWTEFKNNPSHCPMSKLATRGLSKSKEITQGRRFLRVCLLGVQKNVDLRVQIRSRPQLEADVWVGITHAMSATARTLFQTS